MGVFRARWFPKPSGEIFAFALNESFPMVA